MTRMTGPDCVVMCNLINTHTHTHTHTHKHKSYGMAAGTPGGRRHLTDPKEIEGPDGVGPEQLTEEQRVALDTTGPTVGRQGMRVVGVPVGTGQFQCDFSQKAVNGEPAELVRALVPMEEPQASFQILRLSATSCLSHLLRTVSPSITCQAAANYDALVEWALGSIIAGDGAARQGYQRQWK